MSTFIIDVDAEVFGRVAKFRARNDVRYYLGCVHVVPCEDGACLEATNGHRMYIEQDPSAKVDKPKLLSVSCPARLLREGNRVRLNDQNTLSVFDSKGKCLYVEPGEGEVDAQYPDLRGVIGNPAEWRPGLVASANANYLRDALEIGGTISFWRKHRDADPNTIILFTVEHNRGRKAFGAIMPMRALFNSESTAADFVPSRYLAKPEPVFGPAREAA